MPAVSWDPFAGQVLKATGANLSTVAEPDAAVGAPGWWQS
jgi:hypothetical protein